MRAQPLTDTHSRNAVRDAAYQDNYYPSSSTSPALCQRKALSDIFDDLTCFPGHSCCSLILSSAPIPRRVRLYLDPKAVSSTPFNLTFLASEKQPRIQTDSVGSQTIASESNGRQPPRGERERAFRSICYRLVDPSSRITSSYWRLLIEPSVSRTRIDYYTRVHHDQRHTYTGYAFDKGNDDLAARYLTGFSLVNTSILNNVNKPSRREYYLLFLVCRYS